MRYFDLSFRTHTFDDFYERITLMLSIQFCFVVSNFLTENLLNNRDLYEALGNPPVQRTDVRYIQWIGETKEKVEHVLHKDPKVPRLLHACLRHLEVYLLIVDMNGLVFFESPTL